MSNNPDETRYTVTLNVETGYIHLNVLEVLRELSDEQKEELLRDGGFWAFIPRPMMETLRTEFSGEHFNPDIHKMRQTLLTSDIMPDVLREFLNGLMRDFASNIQSLQRYERAYWEIRNHPAMKDDWSRDIINHALLPTNRQAPRYGWVADFVDRMLLENGITLEPYQTEEEE